MFQIFLEYLHLHNDVYCRQDSCLSMKLICVSHTTYAQSEGNFIQYFLVYLFFVCFGGTDV